MMQFLAINSNPPRKSTSIQKKDQKDPLSRSKIKIRQSWDLKIFENLPKISKKSKNRKSEIFEKSEFSEKIENFSGLNFDEFYFSIYSTKIFDFFYGSKWIFEAD